MKYYLKKKTIIKIKMINNILKKNKMKKIKKIKKKIIKREII